MILYNQSNLGDASMDTNTVIVVAILAVVLLVALFIFRRVKAGIKGPLGTGLDIDASNESPTPALGAKVTGSESSAGSIRAEDKTGRGAEVSDSKAKKDIVASSTTPAESNHPKA